MEIVVVIEVCPKLYTFGACNFFRFKVLCRFVCIVFFLGWQFSVSVSEQ